MRKRLFLWSVISAFLILLFTTRSSFLYVCNNWDDANSYFTMGKGMMNGLVIYRDLYDQKGPYLYLLYGIAYLISNKTFLGVFIFEIIAAAFFLYYTGKMIARRSSEKIALILMPIVGACVYSSYSFYFGGAAEEFCLPLLAISLYYLDFILHEALDDEKLTIIFFKVGICAGVIAQVKYTMLGFFFAWFLIIVIWASLNMGFSDVLKPVAAFLIAAFIPSIPWLIYLGATGSLDDYYRCYIYNNIFCYSQVTDENYTLLNKIYEMTKTLYWLVQDAFSYFIWIILGFLLQLIRERGFIKRLTALFMFGCTYFVIFIGGNKLAYYSIPLMVFSLFGACYVGEAFGAALKKSGKKTLGAAYLPILLASVTAGTFFAAVNTMNAEYRGFEAEDIWLMEAKELLSEKDTLLELNTVDPGLYTVTGIVPTCEYFQTNGINLETMFEEQKKYLKEGVTDYVLAVGFEPEYIGINYSLVKVYEYNETDHEETYYLYKKN